MVRSDSPQADNAIQPTHEEQEYPREERRRDYELTALLSATTNDEQRSVFIDTLRRLISDEQGEIIEVAAPRHVALSFPIRHERQGYLASLTFRGGSHLPQRLTDTVRHDTSLLRLLVAERSKTPHRKRTQNIALSETPITAPAAEMTASDEARMEKQIEAALKNETP